jgi:hypothetical protein
MLSLMLVLPASGETGWVKGTFADLARITADSLAMEIDTNKITFTGRVPKLCSEKIRITRDFVDPASFVVFIANECLMYMTQVGDEFVEFETFFWVPMNSVNLPSGPSFHNLNFSYDWLREAVNETKRRRVPPRPTDQSNSQRFQELDRLLHKEVEYLEVNSEEKERIRKVLAHATYQSLVRAQTDKDLNLQSFSQTLGSQLISQAVGDLKPDAKGAVLKGVSESANRIWGFVQKRILGFRDVGGDQSEDGHRLHNGTVPVLVETILLAAERARASDRVAAIEKLLESYRHEVWAAVASTSPETFALPNGQLMQWLREAEVELRPLIAHSEARWQNQRATLKSRIEKRIVAAIARESAPASKVQLQPPPTFRERLKDIRDFILDKHRLDLDPDVQAGLDHAQIGTNFKMGVKSEYSSIWSWEASAMYCNSDLGTGLGDARELCESSFKSLNLGGQLLLGQGWELAPEYAIENLNRIQPTHRASMRVKRVF